MFLTMKLLFLEFESMQEEEVVPEELEEDVARINEKIATLSKMLKSLTQQVSRNVREGSARGENADKGNGHGGGRSEKTMNKQTMSMLDEKQLETEKKKPQQEETARDKGRREKTEEPRQGKAKVQARRRSEPPRGQRRNEQINKFQQLKKAIENIRKISQQDAQQEISRAVATLNLEQSDLVLVSGSNQTTPREQCFQLAQALSTSSAILKSNRPANLPDHQERNPSP